MIIWNINSGEWSAKPLRNLVPNSYRANDRGCFELLILLSTVIFHLISLLYTTQYYLGEASGTEVYQKVRRSLRTDIKPTNFRFGWSKCQSTGCTFTSSYYKHLLFIVCEAVPHLIQINHHNQDIQTFVFFSRSWYQHYQRGLNLDGVFVVVSRLSQERHSE